MAKITVTVEAETGYEMREALHEFLGLDKPITAIAALAARYPPRRSEEDFDETQADATQEVELGERQKRTRRTKAEMEAARAAEFQPTSSASATPASSASAEATPGPQSSSKAPDVFAEQVREANAEVDEENATIDKTTVANLARDAVNKIGAPATRDIYRKHGHAEKLGDMDAKHYAAVYAALTEAMGA